MGFKKIKEDGIYNTLVKTFLIDNSSDLATIETNYSCDIGDIAIASDGTEYIRHSNDITGPKWAFYTENSGGGGGSTESEKDVNLYDNSGNIVASYTKQEFANMTVWPSPPAQDGLISQGWNWDISDAKAYVEKYGLLNVGPLYVTESGNTEIDINIIDGRLTPYLGIGINGEVEINWGDNSNNDVITGNDLNTQVRTPHTYAQEGEYTITIIVNSGSFAFIGTSVYSILSKNSPTGMENISYANMIQAVRIGSNISKIGAYSFYNCYNLKEIFIPKNITAIGQRAFDSCISLTNIVIPELSTTLIRYVFYHCLQLKNVSLPKNAILEDSTFGGCRSLKTLAIPEGNTVIAASLCTACSSLVRVVIPDGVTEIGSNAFSQCDKIIKLELPNTVTILKNNAFQHCENLEEITLSDNITTMEYGAISSCYKLIEVELPSKLTTVGNAAFSYDYNLLTMTIPSQVTSLGQVVFCYAYGITEMHFLSTVPPVASSSDTFSYISTNCKIYVPQGTLSSYTSATNYPSSSTYTYIEE